jgi:hypothetical protein
MKTLFISFYSDNSNLPTPTQAHLGNVRRPVGRLGRRGSNYYSDCFTKLSKRFKALGAEFYAEQLPSRNNYLLNCLKKPRFILDCIEKFDTPVIWIDVDSGLRRLPVLMDSCSTDIGSPIRSGEKPEHVKHNIHAGLLFFNNTKNTKSLLKQWIKLCNKAAKLTEVGKSKAGDHSILLNLISNTDDITVTEYPEDLFSQKAELNPCVLGRFS